MKKEKQKQRTKEIVVKILQLLESENLTVKDSQKILRITEDVISDVSIPVSVPEDVQWMNVLRLPDFTNHRPLQSE